MKKKSMLSFLAVSIGLLTAVSIQAQDTTSVGQDLKSAARKTGKAVGKSAKAVGNKSAELASKGTSAVVDKKFDGKTGPNGQTIYINDKAKYYWVDKKGHRRFVVESELKDKP